MFTIIEDSLANSAPAMMALPAQTHGGLARQQMWQRIVQTNSVTIRARKTWVRSGTMAALTSRLALGVALAAALGGAGAAQQRPSGMGDWTASNFNESSNRYSPLDQINAANVGTLQPAWRFHLKP